MKRKHIVGALITSLAVTLAGGCGMNPPRFVVADPATVAARNDDHWIIRALPKPDAGVGDAAHADAASSAR